MEFLKFQTSNPLCVLASAFVTPFPTTFIFEASPSKIRCKSYNHLKYLTTKSWQHCIWPICHMWTLYSSVQSKRSYHNMRQNIVWQGMWLTIIGEIWKHRNGVIFKQSKIDLIEIFSLAQVTVYVWMKHKISSVKFLYNDWCLSSYTCLKYLWYVNCYVFKCARQTSVGSLEKGTKLI